ncbi:hypothetical protein BO99DRAFT_47077 [Aspergillus violaceofuscus CBS 115571]|uniref:Uncharacterized protein n=1 Tax=Aspergillus violaceofuscus (strain CBS 115571) TaxID=1450538 RepID=A0A2V5GSE9_ASPV1|nr:hypothetical protein BO99DRAFT_47077 [Aspergillus violaceofuscus CBS 115571]
MPFVWMSHEKIIDSNARSVLVILNINFTFLSWGFWFDVLAQGVCLPHQHVDLDLCTMTSPSACSSIYTLR